MTISMSIGNLRLVTTVFVIALFVGPSDGTTPAQAKDSTSQSEDKLLQQVESLRRNQVRLNKQLTAINRRLGNLASDSELESLRGDLRELTSVVRALSSTADESDPVASVVPSGNTLVVGAPVEAKPEARNISDTVYLEAHAPNRQMPPPYRPSDSSGGERVLGERVIARGPNSMDVRSSVPQWRSPEHTSVSTSTIEAPGAYQPGPSSFPVESADGFESAGFFTPEVTIATVSEFPTPFYAPPSQATPFENPAGADFVDGGEFESLGFPPYAWPRAVQPAQPDCPRCRQVR